MDEQDKKAVELADEEMKDVAGGSSEKDQDKWEQEAGYEGRFLKVSLKNRRDNCPSCGTNASMYAKKDRLGLHGIHNHYWLDAKCYSCGAEYDQIN